MAKNKKSKKTASGSGNGSGSGSGSGNMGGTNNVPQLKPEAPVSKIPESPVLVPGSPTRQNSDSNGDRSNVKVLVRVRPRIARELELNSPILVKMNGDSTQLHNPNPIEFSSPTKGKKPDDFNDKSFIFDHSVWSVDQEDPHFKSQEDTYQLIGKEILEHTLSGYNTCIFAYGQTGSGKSYTMMGNEKDPGIIPKTCKDLFQEVGNLGARERAQIKVSYFEIYNEQVRDLLGTNDKPLRVREDPKTGPYVDQLNEFPIQSFTEFQKYMKLGNENRTVASTKMNDQSSRSHAVFTIHLRTTEFNNNEDLVKEKVSCLRLVDLAGSERANSTGASGIRFKEGSNINKSLTTLGRVISALSDGQKPPYRDSILTWILKESLGGNSKTAMIACISPCDYDETLSTLRYATIAKKVKLNATINVDEITNSEHAEELARMKKEIEDLTNSLNEAQKQDVLVNQITNLSKFFEDRLIDQTNKYNLIKLKLEKSNQEKEQNERNLTLIMNSIFNGSGQSSSESVLNDITNDYDKLMNKSQQFGSNLAKDLEKFAPEKNLISTTQSQ